MPQSNDEARHELLAIAQSEDRDVAWIARRIGKSYQWVYRRFCGTTPVDFDDYHLIHSAFDRDLAK